MRDGTFDEVQYVVQLACPYGYSVILEQLGRLYIYLGKYHFTAN
jgi:hypothetical protein